MSKYLAEQISEVVVNTHFEDLPQYAVDKAKMLTLDVLASMRVCDKDFMVKKAAEHKAAKAEEANA